ncbi:MAG TPA: response regulator transcription factor [Polyangia bacterium]|jgi:two-component system phosphate regulon response regulator PhoB|nr:response regulator transcription factor [Polyangia bacterium]HWE31216.1 response regulator transcription factor [Polyangia bacterium]
MTWEGSRTAPIVLVVDDEKDLRSLLDFNLKQSGYRTLQAATGQEALMQAQRHAPDMILLDLNLPDLSGIEVARRLKADPETREIPIVMLTARGSEADRIAGFELGAEDYVPKPFSVRELILRLNVVRRRLSVPRGTDEPQETRRLTCGPIDVDLDACLVRVDGRDLALALLEFRLLVYLMEGQGKVRTREQLLKHVWSYPVDSATRTIETHVKRLRAKLGQAGERIETVRSIGYRIRVES